MRPVAITSVPFSGIIPSRDTAVFQTTPEILAFSSFRDR